MKSDVRLHVILARSASFGVVFRRGPSKRVLLIGWSTSDDTFELGQWLKGRIYERRCDLSPSGDLFLYFAANYRRPHRSWTAISRPPFLTALALWPKGDGWGGGGHFISSAKIALNHRSAEMVLAKGFSLPKWLAVQQFGKRPGWGEDDPIWSERLTRDGWRQISHGVIARQDFNAKVWIELSPPIIWRKPNPLWPERYSLEMSIVGLKEKDGPMYLIEHSISRSDGGTERIGRSDWADWSRSGDLLFAKGGCLFRVACKKDSLPPLASAVIVADFSNCEFEERKAPEEARRWPRR